MIGCQRIAPIQKPIEEFLENLIIAASICIGKRASGLSIDSQAFPSVGAALYRGGNLSQAFQILQLCKEQDDELLPAIHLFRVTVAFETFCNPLELSSRKQLHYLSENCIYSQGGTSYFVVGFRSLTKNRFCDPLLLNFLTGHY